MDGWNSIHNSTVVHLTICSTGSLGFPVSFAIDWSMEKLVAQLVTAKFLETSCWANYCRPADHQLNAGMSHDMDAATCTNAQPSNSWRNVRRDTDQLIRDNVSLRLAAAAAALTLRGLRVIQICVATNNGSERGMFATLSRFAVNLSALLATITTTVTRVVTAVVLFVNEAEIIYGGMQLQVRLDLSTIS